MEVRSYIGVIAGKLFEREGASLAAELTDLVAQNTMKGNPPYGFLYGGQYHTTLPTNLQRTGVKKIIHPDLRERAKAYIDASKELDQSLRQLLTTAKHWLGNIKSEQDLRDLLPEMIIKLEPRLALLPRTRPVGYLHQDSPLMMHQFQQFVEMLEFHAANRIF